jgi:hypothetical protein
MISGDLALAVGIAALALVVGRTLRSPDTTVAVGLLAAAAVGIVVQALAREDCNTALTDCTARAHAGQLTWHHDPHSPASALAFLVILGAPSSSPARSVNSPASMR